MDLPVFVVGLEKSKERYQKTMKMLADLGIEAQLWQGVDGRQPLQFEKGETYRNYENYVVRGYPFSSTEVGCYLSHYRLMKYALTQKWDRIFVIEDDIIHCDGFSKQSLIELFELDQSFEYIHFAWKRSLEIPKRAYTLTSGARLFRPRLRLKGTWAYAVSRQGIKKLLPRLMPMQREIDMAITDSFLLGVRGFVLKPNLVRTNSEITPIITRRSNSKRGKVRAIVQRRFSILVTYPLYYRYISRKYALQQAYFANCDHEEATAVPQNHLRKSYDS